MSNRTKLTAPFWASFVVTPAGEALLAGCYACRYVGLNETERHWPHAVGFDAAGIADADLEPAWRAACAYSDLQELSCGLSHFRARQSL